MAIDFGLLRVLFPISGVWTADPPNSLFISHSEGLGSLNFWNTEIS